MIPTETSPAADRPAIALTPATVPLTSQQQAVLNDLHWLIHQGHVIEFASGLLETAKKPAPRPTPTRPERAEKKGPTDKGEISTPSASIPESSSAEPAFEPAAKPVAETVAATPEPVAETTCQTPEPEAVAAITEAAPTV